MVSNQDVCNASLESSTDSRGIGRTCSCDKNHFRAFCSDFLLETRNRKTCEVVWWRVDHFINAAAFCIKNPVVDIYGWVEWLDRIDVFPAEDSSYNYFIIRVWEPESHHDHTGFFAKFDCLPRYRGTGIRFYEPLWLDSWYVRMYDWRNRVPCV